MTDLYAILEVPKSADPDAIDKAYRRRSKATHPDRGGEAKDFHAVDQAYRVLADPNRRATYDETGQFEEAKPDNQTSDAMQVISFYLTKVLASMHQVSMNPKKDNVLASLKTILKEVEKEIEKSKTAAKNLIDGLKIAAERFETKDGPNVIAEMIKFNIAASERQVLAFEGEKAKIANALVVLEQYTYRVDKSEMLFSPGSWRGTAASTSSFYMPPFRKTRDGEY